MVQRGAERTSAEGDDGDGEGATVAPIDGRTLRSIRTRSAVVDALLGLIEEGDVRPTAPRIAERAGVSLRSVFQHFNDLEALHAAVARQKLEEVAAVTTTIDPTLPREERVAEFIDQRTRILEMLTPIRRASLAQMPLSVEGKAGERALMELGRSTVATAFAPELAADECPEALLEALNMVCSWQAWEALRAYQGLEIERAKAIVTRTVQALLPRQ